MVPKITKEKMSCIKISNDVRSHLALHFQRNTLGSTFFFSSPEELLDKAMTMFPEKFYDAILDSDERIRISLIFPEEIGISKVVSFSELTNEEKQNIKIIDRDGKKVRAVITDRIITTNECQIILSKDWHLITMFPGELAPPLPDSPTIPDRYWDTHLFLIPKDKNSKR